MTLIEENLVNDALTYSASLGVRQKPKLVCGMQQAWLDSTDPMFQPGVVLSYFQQNSIVVTAVLVDYDIRNRASALNQLTWRLGDVFEAFFYFDGQDEYFEIHVTPENQRLQLQWRLDHHTNYRVFEPIENVMINDPNFVCSSTKVFPKENRWFVSLKIPFKNLNQILGHPKSNLRMAFCRYDVCGQNVTLSATAAFPKEDFHLIEFWHSVDLHQSQAGHPKY